MENYAMQFENVIKRFLGKPKTNVYFASFFEDNFATRALLFSICVKEINCNPSSYSDEKLNQISTFKELFQGSEAEYNDIINCVKFFSERPSDY